MKEIVKAYEPQKYEKKIYKTWEKSGFFNPDNLSGKPYSIMMPPPNVTGVLHLGHALENSLMDIMARFKRLQGRKVLLLPGTDHAAVATQAKVEKLLISKGIKNPRQKLGREGLLKEVREYAENSKKTILTQIKRMGTSCDWSRLAYTFDEERNKAVNTVFKKMYDDGLIYQGFRAVNWSIKGQSTLSDDEIVYVPRKAKFYTFKYSKDFPFTIATTRPETKLGDTAVAVNPKDNRYKKYIGKEFDVDFVGQKLKLKIIADRGVDMGFGTGALGVTPAHSLVDYDMGIKNNLEMIQVIGEDGKMTVKAGKFKGLTVEEAREMIVKNLKKSGLLIKEEDIDQNVGTSDRFGDIVEVLPKTQWFVNVNKKITGRNKSLKQLMKESVGKNKDQVNIAPKRFEKTYFTWIDNLRDWCISRQIWWGHRLPVWYKGDDIFVGDKPKGSGWKQDEDTLDTWFSSGLWTFSTLGWPEKSKDFKNFYPTDWMQMGHEILFFWMARMILMSEYVLDKIPFKDVYIHGILRDEKGEKFSKSSGNSLDPLDVIEKYGTDALRFSLLAGVTPGQDQRFYIEKVEAGRNLVNKIWNISRYINSSIVSQKASKNLTLTDKWILSKLNTLIIEVTSDIEKYNFSQAVEKLREFTWSDFADWYLEVSKIETGKEKILKEILEKLLILWHPFIPYVTEVIWSEMLGKKDLIIAKWPTSSRHSRAGGNPRDFEKIKNIVTQIRNYKKEGVGTLTTLNAKLFEDNWDLIKGLLKFEINFKKEKTNSITFYFLDKEDKDKKKKLLESKLEEKEKYLEVLNKKLSNKDFVDKAPKNVVDIEKEKQKKVMEEVKQLKDQLKNY